MDVRGGENRLASKIDVSANSKSAQDKTASSDPRLSSSDDNLYPSPNNTCKSPLGNKSPSSTLNLSDFDFDSTNLPHKDSLLITRNKTSVGKVRPVSTIPIYFSPDKSQLTSNNNLFPSTTADVPAKSLTETTIDEKTSPKTFNLVSHHNLINSELKDDRIPLCQSNTSSSNVITSSNLISTSQQKPLSATLSDSVVQLRNRSNVLFDSTLISSSTASNINTSCAPNPLQVASSGVNSSNLTNKNPQLLARSASLRQRLQR